MHRRSTLAPSGDVTSGVTCPSAPGDHRSVRELLRQRPGDGRALPPEAGCAPERADRADAWPGDHVDARAKPPPGGRRPVGTGGDRWNDSGSEKTVCQNRSSSSQWALNSEPLLQADQHVEPCRTFSRS